MTVFVRFEIAGQPQGKQRARSTKGGWMYTPAKTVAYERDVAIMARQAMAGRPAFAGPCFVQIDAYLQVPASWPKKRRAMALAGELYPTTKPDADNIAKVIADGANGIVWIDDAQIVDARVRKRYASVPTVAVDVMALVADGVAA